MNKIISKINLILLFGIFAANFLVPRAQTEIPENKDLQKASFITEGNRNFLLKAGYSQQAIDAKIAKTWYKLFEEPRKGYFAWVGGFSTTPNNKTLVEKKSVFLHSIIN